VNHGVPRRTGKEDHTVLQVRGYPNQGVIEVEAVAIRHQEITDYCRDIGIPLDRLQGIPTGFRLGYGKTSFLEDLAQSTPDRTFIVDEEDCRHALQTRSGGRVDIGSAQNLAGIGAVCNSGSLEAV
jgi:hypothetical protein